MDAKTEQMIATHLSLAQSLAQQEWRKAPHALELDELRAIAYLGLVQAALRWWGYCEEKQYSPDALEFFKPFVVRRVKGAIIDAVRANDWATRSLRTKAKALQDAGQDKGVSDAELAARSGMSIAGVRDTVRGMASRPISLEASDLELGADHDVESAAVTGSILNEVVNTVRALPADQQVVIALHYYQGLQLQQIAQEMGIPESRASELHARSVTAILAVMVRVAQTEDQ